MSTEGDRRAPGASRVPFEALVEVGGSMGPSFEAQSIDISEEGMHLRTAYLPDIGQPLTCRFDAGPGGANVLAAGEVVWKQEADRGGEFAIRFTNLDGEGLAALSRMIGTRGAPIQAAGSRVRLHIDGLNSPMRARVKDASGTEVTAFSELGFLQVGKLIDLEDATSGNKRPASIERVKVEIDTESRVPQLVVTLKYDDAQAHDEAARSGAHAASRIEMPRPSSVEIDIDEAPVTAVDAAREADDLESIEAGAGKMKGAFARGASKVGPAFSKMLNRAKVTIALLAARRRADGGDPQATPLRRTTAKAPGGGLHTSGRKVVRGEPVSELVSETPNGVPRGLSMNKRRVAIGSAVFAAVVLMVVAFKKPAPQPPLASAPTAETAPAAVAPPPSLIPTPEPIAASTAPTPLLPEPFSADNAPHAKDPADKHAHKKAAKVVSFGNGPVAHGNVLRIKMDGAIEKIEGAAQPTGFTVVIPSRRSLEAASPLASRDSRIASIRVANDPNGAELAVAFKDGVPNYLVRAKGDTLEIVLAPLGHVGDDKPAAGAHPAKHADIAKAHHKGHKGAHNKH